MKISFKDLLYLMNMILKINYNYKSKNIKLKDKNI